MNTHDSEGSFKLYFTNVRIYSIRKTWKCLILIFKSEKLLDCMCGDSPISFKNVNNDINRKII